LNGLFDAASEVSSFMSERDWKHCVIGGLAVQQWGEPRTTLDVDFALLTGWGEEEPYVDALLSNFESRISNGRNFALENRVLLLCTQNNHDIDIALSALPFEEDMVQRAKRVEFAPGHLLPCCTAEDLFVMKVFAGRPRDWLDAESVANRQDSLDKDYIIGQLEPLCAMREDRDTITRVERILDSVQ